MIVPQGKHPIIGLDKATQARLYSEFKTSVVGFRIVET